MPAPVQIIHVTCAGEHLATVLVPDGMDAGQTFEAFLVQEAEEMYDGPNMKGTPAYHADIREAVDNLRADSGWEEAHLVTISRRRRR